MPASVPRPYPNPGTGTGPSRSPLQPSTPSEGEPAGLSDAEIQNLLESLAEITGNTYGVNEEKELVLVEAGSNSSETATDFLNELIGSSDVYKVHSRNNDPSVVFGNASTDSLEIRIDFGDYKQLDYGKVDPSAFNPGTTFLHEAAHVALGLKDPPPGRKFQEIGDTVSFVNRIRGERGLPLRGPIYGGVSRGFWGRKVGINFFNSRDPDRIYYIEFPEKLLR